MIATTAARLPPALSPITPIRPGVGAETGRVLRGPDEAAVAVVDRRREPVRRGQPVVDRHHDRVEIPGDDAGAPVHLTGAAEREAAAVEVEDQGPWSARPGLRGVDPERDRAVRGVVRRAAHRHALLQAAEDQRRGATVRDHHGLRPGQLLVGHPGDRGAGRGLHHPVQRADTRSKLVGHRSSRRGV